jgi:hypothetical protein
MDVMGNLLWYILYALFWLAGRQYFGTRLHKLGNENVGFCTSLATISIPQGYWYTRDEMRLLGTFARYLVLHVRGYSKKAALVHKGYDVTIRRNKQYFL